MVFFLKAGIYTGAMKNLIAHKTTLFLSLLGFCLLWISGCSSCQRLANTKVSMEEIIGEDKNQNGVRDDVENFINSQSGISENVKAAMMQNAKAIQKALKVGGGPESKEVAEEIFRAVQCMGKVTREQGPDWDSVLESKVVNTSARSQRYIEFNASLSGGLYGAPSSRRRPSCDFELRESPKNRVNQNEEEDQTPDDEDNPLSK